jgi:probable rRNA maturation factor
MRNQKPLIHFHATNGPLNLKQRTKLKGFITYLFDAEKTALEELHYIFCSDEYLLHINQQFLYHDAYTDIITFNLAAPSEPIISDIYISTDRVKENAGLLNTSFSLELHRVILHGALHLCNYRDKSKKEKDIMRQMEDLYLSQYFVSRETI